MTAPETQLLPKGEAIPDGWKPMVDFVMPDGTHTTTHAVAEGHGARPPEEIYRSIRKNMTRGLPALTGRADTHDRTAILCCYGPSLRDTWRLATNMPGDVWTVSGAHKFLLSKGFESHFHSDVDPRDHKAKFVEAPVGGRTKFFVPSRASPAYFDNLAGSDVTMYHLRCKEEVPVIKEMDPAAFICSSGITAGLATCQLLLTLGYRRIEIFGMDGSADARDGAKYLADHPNKDEPFNSLVEIHGRMFATNMLMLLAIDDFFAIATQWPMGTFNFHGDGMMQWVERVARRAHEQVS